MITIRDTGYGISGQDLKIFNNHTNIVTSFTVIPDGTLASAFRDGTIKMWDTFNGLSFISNFIDKHLDR